MSLQNVFETKSLHTGNVMEKPVDISRSVEVVPDKAKCSRRFRIFHTFFVLSECTGENSGTDSSRRKTEFFSEKWPFSILEGCHYKCAQNIIILTCCFLLAFVLLTFALECWNLSWRPLV